MNCCNKRVETAAQLVNVSEPNWNKLHFLRQEKVQLCIVAVYFYTNNL